jgi:hypothetical protein
MIGKKTSIGSKNELQLITDKLVNSSYPPINKPIKIKNIRDAKRLLSRLIYHLQIGTVENQTAKDLCYLTICYINVIKELEFEARLKNLEEKANNNQ